MSVLLTHPVPLLFDGVIDRADTDMPNWYFPSAEGVLIAGEEARRERQDIVRDPSARMVTRRVRPQEDCARRQDCSLGAAVR